MRDVKSTIPAAEAFALHGLLSQTPHGIASRVLANTSGGSVTLFAFDAGELERATCAETDTLLAWFSNCRIFSSRRAIWSF